MSGSSIRWVTPPSELTEAIRRYGDRVYVAIHAVAEYVGVKMQNEARRGAAWTDRTANARGGLFYAVDGFGVGEVVGDVDPGSVTEFERDREAGVQVSGDGDNLIIALGHTMYYGKFLEVAHGGSYAIIMSTIESNIPVLEQMLQQLLSSGRSGGIRV